MVILDMVVRWMSSVTVPTWTMILEEIGGLSILLDDRGRGRRSCFWRGKVGGGLPAFFGL
jgi:hypothetical protein